ncbi:Retinoic acid induced 14 [Phytophthora boehmeriae]|uniref:Retinoic acid induced 14 n=1 Tax=Phytophthora boehmeriae TaxID=109152 RepID=A0A8T1X503_9STRA|nr:Retinoic acid induced 14 [Phytophthora boehmeriae]
MKRSSGQAPGDDAEQEERGAELKLAQRHRKIVAGDFKVRKALELEFATPGVVGKLALSFTTTGSLPKHSRITCQFPDHGWALPSDALNAVLQLPSPNEHAANSALPQVKALWMASTRTLEVTLLNDTSIPADTPLVLVVSGVFTPETATPQGEAIVTTFEKLAIRSTVPQSTRGGQIIDGPTVFAIPKIVPGCIDGAKRWSPFNCCPGAISDVTLSFIVSGKVPSGGKLLVELPEGWDMDEQPKVLLRSPMYHNKSFPASWDRKQHTLEIRLGNDKVILMKTKVILTIQRVKNPDKETLSPAVSAARDAPVAARLTTLSANGGVVDGPSKLEVARISELREKDFEIIIKVIDADAAENGSSAEGRIPIARVPDLLRQAGLTLSDELFQSLVVPCFPTRDTVPIEDRISDSSPNSPPISARSSGVPPEGEDIKPSSDYLTKEEMLSVFAVAYAPAYKYGQDLRLACGRGHLELVREWVSRGCNPNAGDGSGWSSLHYAADYGQLEVLNLLVEMTALPPGVDTADISLTNRRTLEINARDAHGWTPLICAAANGYVEVLQRLLELGADISLPSVEKRSALHWAATRGMTTAMSALLAAGADVNQVDRSGWTPLQCAMLHGNAACVTILTEHGASLTVKDRLNYMPEFYSDATFLIPAPAQ